MGSGYRARLAGAAADRLWGIVRFKFELGRGRDLQYRDPGHVGIEFHAGHVDVDVDIDIACVDGECQADVLWFIFIVW